MNPERKFPIAVRAGARLGARHLRQEHRQPGGHDLGRRDDARLPRDRAAPAATRTTRSCARSRRCCAKARARRTWAARRRPPRWARRSRHAWPTACRSRAPGAGALFPPVTIGAQERRRSSRNQGWIADFWSAPMIAPARADSFSTANHARPGHDPRGEPDQEHHRLARHLRHLRHQAVGARPAGLGALQRKLLDRQLRNPLESCLLAEDGVTAADAAAARRERWSSATRRWPRCCEPHADEHRARRCRTCRCTRWRNCC